MQLGRDHNITDVEILRVNHSAHIGVSFRTSVNIDAAASIGVQLCCGTLCCFRVRIAYGDNVKSVPQLVDDPEMGTGPPSTSNQGIA
jgi:hypothetical protein